MITGAQEASAPPTLPSRGRLTNIMNEEDADVLRDRAQKLCDDWMNAVEEWLASRRVDDDLKPTKASAKPAPPPKRARVVEEDAVSVASTKADPWSDDEPERSADHPVAEAS